MTALSDGVFYRGDPKRNIPAGLSKEKDTADFMQSLLRWRSHLKRTGEPYLWPATVAVPDDCITLPSAAVSRTKYAALFSVYGTTLGPGDGSTTFDLPTITAPVGCVVVIQI